jgi:signal transduction histidine kinase
VSVEAVPQPRPEEARRQVLQGERLLACFQKALGHELPNQLVAIQGLARVLEEEEGGRLDDDGRDYLRRLGAAAQRAHELVNALAAMGRALRSPPAAEPVSLAEAFREAVAEVTHAGGAPAAGFRGPRADAVLVVPRVQLREVLVQLLANALQAAGERPPVVEAGARETARGGEFWLADNGRGLSDRQLARLFEPFASAGPTRKGLGLFLVRQVVEGWGGGVRVGSEPGQGTVVTVSLPAALFTLSGPVAESPAEGTMRGP